LKHRLGLKRIVLDSIRKAETAIEVAMISASMNGQDTGTEEPQTDPFMEELERQKLALQQKKIDEDTNLKGRALSEAERKNRVAEQQKEQEIKIKRTAANRPVAKPKTK
jgi:hypothetical protein